MTNNGAMNSHAPYRESGIWRPKRQMGLARALQKSGYATRRQADAMVLAGRVKVDGDVCLVPTSMVGPKSTIQLDNQDLLIIQRVYFAFNKPPRVACSDDEGLGHRLIGEYLPQDVPGLFAAGRLDSKVTGLLLVSNDAVWNTLIADSVSLEQEYRIQVEGELTEMELGVLASGVHLPKFGFCRPTSVEIDRISGGRTDLTVILHQGKVRQIRRMLSTLRHRIIWLRRERIGNLKLDDLSAGRLRQLDTAQVEAMARAAVQAPPVDPLKG